MFTIQEVLTMQDELQEKYKDIWKPICPEVGQNKLLWMVGEIGEVIDVIKKNGYEKVTESGELRDSLVEELADVLMYYGDILNCYGISEDELKEAYVKKFHKNLNRW